MAEAVAEKTKIKDDEFDIHGDLAVSEADDKSFVVLYDSSQENPEKVHNQPAASQHTPVSSPAQTIAAPTLEDIDATHDLEPARDVHPEDAYIDDILSSDDLEPLDAPSEIHAVNDTISAPAHTAAAGEDEDGPIALSSEELDGILEMGPATEEEFHPDFPVEQNAPAVAPPAEPQDIPLAAAPHESSFDDEELPIALSDEDLDEILLEEEGAHTAPVAELPAAEPAVSAPVMEPAPTGTIGGDFSDDEEPIALSDDELDHILADAEAGHTESHVAAPELQPVADEDEVLTLDEDPELTLIDDSSPALADTHSAAQNEAGGFFDSDEDEPITLSDEELDGILSSAPEEEAGARHTDEVALADLPSDGTVEVEDDEPIALSNEELDGILMDAEEAPVGEMAADAPHETHAGGTDFFDSDADEPIALSADELDGIAATAETEDAPPTPPLAELPPEAMDGEGTASPGMDDSGPEAMDGEGTTSPGMDDSGPEAMDGEGIASPGMDDGGTDAAAAMDARYADVDHMDDTAATEEPLASPADAAAEDDGPIALSSDELDGIVADSREVTPEAPMMPLSPMDTGADEPSIADNADKPATVFEEDLDAATLIHEDEAGAAAAPAPDTEELKSVMTYLDNLLGELPDDVIEKFAQSEYFKMYQKIMDKLGL
ncbi:MAG: hypothetical protein KF713_10205 [Turneriella sp.]|nr:hypothetical protein [Turneriella sp.]